MTKYMQCNTCRKTVLVNPTGICLACQNGFSKETYPDEFLWNEMKEKLDAAKERNNTENNQFKHKGVDKLRNEEKTSDRSVS